MKVIVNGLATEYTDEGQGTQLLMLHGWGDNARTFDPLVSQLSNCRIVRLDLPGFGATDQPKDPWKVADYALFVSAFLQKLQFKPDIILGHSLGGRITIKGMAMSALNAEKIVLIASAGIAKRRTLRNGLFFIVAKVGKFLTAIWPLSLLRWKMQSALYRSAKSDYGSAGKLKDTFLRIISEDLSEDAARLSIPTLLIWGEEDSTTPMQDGRRLQSVIPHSTFVSVPNAGHFVHREYSKDVAAAIIKFI